MTVYRRVTRSALALVSILAACIIAASAFAHPIHRQDRPYDPSAYVYGGASVAVATAIQALGYSSPTR